MASQVDWEAVEREYRAGQLSVSEIGRQLGVSHTAINKRAKKEGWTRDLSAKVRKEVSARLVSDEVSATNAREAVELAATRGVTLVRQHQKSLGRAHGIAEKLMAELERGTDNVDEIEDEIATATEDDQNSNRRNAMLKAVSLPSRASTLRELSQTLKNLIPLERQAFNLDARSDDEPSDTDTAFGALAKALDVVAASKSRDADGAQSLAGDGPA